MLVVTISGKIVQLSSNSVLKVFHVYKLCIETQKVRILAALILNRPDFEVFTGQSEDCKEANCFMVVVTISGKIVQLSSNSVLKVLHVYKLCIETQKVRILAALILNRPDFEVFTGQPEDCK